MNCKVSKKYLNKMIENEVEKIWSLNAPVQYHAEFTYFIQWLSELVSHKSHVVLVAVVN